jgi:outer membrane protein assembly factor BamB
LNVIRTSSLRALANSWRISTFRAAAVLLAFLGAVHGDAAEPASPALGSADFRPSPEHPFGWRGDGTGQFPGAAPAISWSDKKNVRWSATVGHSYSSPIITDKLVLVTSEPNLLVCLDRANGKELWRVATTPADLADEKGRKMAKEYEPPADGSGLAAATPLTDGKMVYAVFANGLIRAVSIDGQPKWTAFIEADQNTGFGRSSSPILVGGKLIVNMTDLRAFDPATGKELWRNADATSSYGTPVGMKIGDTEVIVTPRGATVRASDGKAVNSNELGQATHSSPVAADGVVYFVENTVSAVRLDAAFKDQPVWTSTIDGDVFCSPILLGDTLFTATGSGNFLTFNVKGQGETKPVGGERLLFGEPPEGAGAMTYASFTQAGKYLFLNSNKGDMVVLEATREAKEVARNHLPGGIGSTPVFSGQDMFVRCGEKLYCIGE